MTDTPSFKARPSPDGQSVALIMNAGAFDALALLVERSAARAGEDVLAHREAAEAALGAIMAARHMLGRK